MRCGSRAPPLRLLALCYHLRSARTVRALPCSRYVYRVQRDPVGAQRAAAVRRCPPVRSAVTWKRRKSVGLLLPLPMPLLWRSRARGAGELRSLARWAWCAAAQRWRYRKRIPGPLMDRKPAAPCGPTSASRRPQAARRRALRASEKLTSDGLVPRAAQRADPGTGGPQAPSGVDGCGARSAGKCRQG